MMANEFPTLLDLKNVLAPGDGSLMDIAEILVEDNEALKDIPWEEGNLITGATYTLRASMPRSEIRALNEGIESSTSRKEQKTATCVEITSRSEIDLSEIKLAPDKAKFLLQEARPHIAVMGEYVVHSFFYGTDRGGVLGIANRLGSLKGDTAHQVVDFEGNGNKLTSAYCVKWEASEVTGVYPKNSAAGLEKINIGVQLVPDSTGKKRFSAQVDEYKWNFGFKVRDHRYISRLANIDLDAVLTDEAARKKLFERMIQMKERVRKNTQGKICIYVSPDLYEAINVSAFHHYNNFVRFKDTEHNGPLMEFMGIVIKKNDCQQPYEKKVD